MKEKDLKYLFLSISQKFRVDTKHLFGSKPTVEVANTKDSEIIVINGKPLLARSEGVLFPTLIFHEIFSNLPKVAVDMNAIKHICNGADIMAPGVVQIEGVFQEGELILIIDELHQKSLAIGLTLFNSQIMNTLKRGKIVKNIHYIGDKLWSTTKEFS